MTCKICKRTIKIDNLKGKPAGAKGYCLGLWTCVQQAPMKGKGDT